MDVSEVQPQRALVAFLSHKDDIKELLEAGHSCRWIHQKLSGEDRLPVTYRHFLRLCDRYLENASPRKRKTTKSVSTPISHDEHTKKGPIMTYDPRLEKKTLIGNISTIGKEYLLEQAEKK